MRHLPLTVFFLAVTVTATAAPPTVSRETTYYLGPLDDEGYVDYAAALDKQFGEKGVKPQDSVFVGIFENVDTSDWDEAHLAGLLARIETAPLPDGVRPFIWLDRWPDFAKLDEQAQNEILDAVTAGRWAPAEQPVVEAWLEEMGPALDRIASALERPAYFSPLILNGEQDILVNVLVPQLGTHRQIGRAFLIRVYRNIEAGDLDAAIDDILTLERLSRWQTHEALAVSHLVSMSINALAHYLQHALLAHPGLTMKHLNSLRRSRTQLPPRIETAKSILDGERAYVLDLISFVTRPTVGIDEATAAVRSVIGSFEPHDNDRDQAIAAAMAKLLRDPQFNTDRALRRVNAFGDHFATVPAPGPDRPDWIESNADLGETFGAKREELIPQILVWGRTGIAPGIDPDAVADAVADVLQSFAGVNAWVFAVEQQNLILDDLEDVGIALAIYRLREGQYSESLDALTPKYLKSDPLDSTNGKPLIYRPEGAGYLLYSVGMDLEDDGGVDDFSVGDIVMRLEPEPAH